MRSLWRPAGCIDIPPLAVEDVQARHGLRVPQPNGLIPGRAQDYLLLPGHAPLNTGHLRVNHDIKSKTTHAKNVHTTETLHQHFAYCYSTITHFTADRKHHGVQLRGTPHVSYQYCS